MGVIGLVADLATNYKLGVLMPRTRAHWKEDNKETLSGHVSLREGRSDPEVAL